MSLTKAQLLPKDAGVPTIEFMFNPTELTFEKQVETSENKGARTEDKGQPKVGFANTSSYKVTINKIMFDTYETGENVVEKHIEPFRKAVQFPDGKGNSSSTSVPSFSGLPSLGSSQGGGGGGGGGEKTQRTPLYTFVWGKNVYLRYCFVEKLTYKLTLFLPDGTPVRAVIDSLTLKEADEPKPNQDMSAPKVSETTRRQDSLSNRQSGTQAAAPRRSSRPRSTRRR